jgi:predicted AlkP superfamily pyrophosphatase or phosphodiesterase
MVKVVLVIMDGVGFGAGISQCGYLEGAVEQQRARRWKMLSCLPTISAPLYETIHTGVSPIDHGITGNEAIRQSTQPNVFSTLKKAGRRSAAVAHSFFHTLYGEDAFDPFRHSEIEDADAAISHARYYSMEGSSSANACVPSEIDLCAQAVSLVENRAPDYLLLHSSSADTLGHFFGGASAEYHKQVWRIDNALSRAIPRFLGAGYEILVTADHGMNSEGHHGGTEPSVRETAFYYFGNADGPAEDETLDQRAIAPSILSRIGVAIPDTMRVTSILR